MHAVQWRRRMGWAPGILILMSGMAPAANAVDYTWWEQAPAGYWDDPLSWLPYGVPGSGSGASILSKYDGVLDPVYRCAASPKLRALVIDTPSGTGSVHFHHSQDKLASEKATIGVLGLATYTQNGGQTEFDLLRLGEWEPSKGIYKLQGSATLQSTHTEVGSAGQGDFTLGGSALHSTERLWVNDRSIYRIQGGRLIADNVAVDSDFVQTSGEANINTELKLQMGLVPPAAKAALEGGKLRISGTLAVPYGTFEQIGGEFSCGTLDNGGPSLCSVVDGTFKATLVNNSGYYGQSGGLAEGTLIFHNLPGATFMQSGGIWTGSKFTNQSVNMLVMGTADLRIRTLTNEGTLKLAAGILRGPLAMPGLYWICEATNAGTFRMEGGAFRGRLTNDGTFEYVGGDFSTSVLILNGTFTRSGAFSCQQLTNHTDLAADTTRKLNVSGTNYAAAIENTGTLNVSGQAVSVSSTSPLLNKGELRGSGTIAARVRNEGILTVGTEIAAVTLSVDGDFRQEPAGDLRMNIAEALPGTAVCDKLAVAGAAALAGEFTLTTFRYTPKKADRWVVMTFASRTGEFQTWNLPVLSAGLTWAREYTDGSLALVVRPPMGIDFDSDGDIDADDMASFSGCISGPARPHINTPACGKSDLDDDGDVDQNDFGVFQRCYAGPGVPAEPSCAG